MNRPDANAALFHIERLIALEPDIGANYNRYSPVRRFCSNWFRFSRQISHLKSVLARSTPLKDLERMLLSVWVGSVFHGRVRFSSGGCARMKNGKRLHIVVNCWLFIVCFWFVNYEQ